MRIVIIGGGDVGQELSKNLFARGHEVVLVDKDQQKVERLSQELDFTVINGSGANLEILHKAKIKSAHILIAVTESDEVNIIACMIAKTLGVRYTVARVRDPEAAGDIEVDAHGLTREQVGIDTIISPEKAVAQEIAKMIHLPGAVEIGYFAGGLAMMVAVYVTEKAQISGQSIEKLPLPKGCIVVGVRRPNGDFFLPVGKDVIKTGDKVYLAGSSSVMAEASWLMHGEKTRVKRVVILGGGMIGYNLAAILEANRKQSFIAKIIEKSEERCDMLYRNLSKTTVVQGDETEISYFNEEEIAEAHILVSVTGDDCTNIVASVMGQRLGVKIIISEVTRIMYKHIYDTVGITQIVNPHQITAAQILRYTHKEDVVSLSLLKDEVAEVEELVLLESAEVVGKSIARANLPNGLLVGAIVRNNEVIIPDGKTVFQPRDHLVIFAMPRACSQLECFL